MKIKFTCSWTNDKSLYSRILSNYGTDPSFYDILTFNDDYDYLVIINDIQDKSKIKNYDKTIGLVMEPSWHHWNKDLYKLCKVVMFHDKLLYNYDNVIEWTNCGFMHDIISHEMFCDTLPDNMNFKNTFKSKLISFICGEKNDSKDGYKLRKQLSDYFDTNNKTVDIYGKNFIPDISKNIYGPLLLKYNGLINYKFSICIENSYEKGYITEKLYDCFMCDTVPIYCGAPNVLDIFTKNNLIQVNNFDECISVIDKINNGEISHNQFDTKSAKLKYINELNLIKQVLNTIDKCKEV